jgi:hypothetical protein
MDSLGFEDNLEKEVLVGFVQYNGQTSLPLKHPVTRRYSEYILQHTLAG